MKKEQSKKKWFDAIEEAIYPHSEDLYKPLFRIIPFDVLIHMLNEKKNTLVRTSKWEDTYENFLLKENFVLKGNNHSLEKISELIFGQCWTTRLSSDAMWRIYSPDKKSVRIKTTIGRLWKSVQQNNDKKKFVIGKVQYFPQAIISSDLESKSPFKLNELSNLMLSSLFVKRNSFSHEAEYRLIYMCDTSSNDCGKDIQELDIDPLEFIMSIYFDPRVDKTYMERCKNVLVKAFGYPADRIHKSTLYEFKPSRIEIVE